MTLMPRWSQQWRVGIATGVITVVCAVLAVVVLAHAPRSESSAGPGSAHAGTERIATLIPDAISWIPGEPSSGMSYDKPTEPPKVSHEAALLKAGTHPFGYPYKGTAKPSARYELMSFDHPEEWAAVLEAKGLGVGRKFTKVPVWIVSYEGVTIYGSGPAPEEDNPYIKRGEGVPLETRPINREFNIVVSAENGEVLGSFTYR